MNILLIAPIWGYEGGVERYIVDCIVELATFALYFMAISRLGLYSRT